MEKSESFVVNPLRRGKWGEQACCTKRGDGGGGGGDTVCRHMCKLWKQPLELAQPLPTMATKFQGESQSTPRTKRTVQAACAPHLGINKYNYRKKEEAANQGELNSPCLIRLNAP